MQMYQQEVTLTEDGRLTVESLPFHAGERVQVFVLTVGSELPAELRSRYPLWGTVLRYDDPTEPAVPPEDWEALR